LTKNWKYGFKITATTTTAAATTVNGIVISF
jgi:hypothetical protein